MKTVLFSHAYPLRKLGAHGCSRKYIGCVWYWFNGYVIVGTPQRTSFNDRSGLGSCGIWSRLLLRVVRGDQARNKQGRSIIANVRNRVHLGALGNKGTSKVSEQAHGGGQ